jgi:hypothetical protein
VRAVANKKPGNDLVATLIETVMKVRRDLLVEQPIFARLPPQARTLTPIFRDTRYAAFYNGT